MIISIANQKGGVGKTTTSQGIAAGLLKNGFSVLMIDLDPQANLSTATNVDTSTSSIYEVMRGDMKLQDAIQKSNCGDIVAANILLASADIEFYQKMKREELLKSVLAPVIEKYDFIIIDTPPALGILTVNAFTASDRIIIPMGADMFSLQGVGQLGQTIQEVKKHCNHNLGIEGILLTKYNSRTILSRDLFTVVTDFAKNLGTKVFDTKIRSSVSVQEAQTQKENILMYSPNATAQTDYATFVTELLNGLNK